MPAASRTRPRKRTATKAKTKPRAKMKARVTVQARTPKVTVPKPIGKVVHYYDRIGVAIVEVASKLSLGDSVLLKRGDEEFCQRVGSLQLEHKPITRAGKGKVIGMKVDKPVREGTVVLPT